MFKQIRSKKCDRITKRSSIRQNLPGIISVFLIIFLCSSSFGGSKRKTPEKFEFDRQIRVWLGATDSVSLSSSGEMIVECFRNGDRGEIYYTSSAINLIAGDRGLTVMDNNGILALELTSVVLKPRFPNVFLDYEDKRYRGYIECDRSVESPHVRVFNLIDIEQYLKGVLPGELGERTEDEYEAAKAQAIAARTYAVWKLSSQADDKHIKNSIDDQLYLGAAAEMPLLNKAVRETEGMIITYNRLPIAAYYHAVCGGSTSPIEKVWQSSEIPYLTGTVDGDYCQWAKTFFWNEEFKLDKLKANLSSYLSNKGKLSSKGLGRITSIKFNKDHSIGRMIEMKISTTTGEFNIKSDQIRWALKRSSTNGILPSTRFNARIKKSNGSITGIELVGAGNGHGIGMCQCGAIGRARDGQSYDDIINKYYNDVTIEKIY